MTGSSQFEKVAFSEVEGGQEFIKAEGLIGGEARMTILEKVGPEKAEEADNYHSRSQHMDPDEVVLIAK